MTSEVKVPSSEIDHGQLTKSITRVKSYSGQIVSYPVLKPVRQAQVTGGYRSYYVHNASTAPRNLFRNTGSKYTYNVPAGSFDKLDGLALKFNITEGGASNSMSVCPTPYWFSRIVVKTTGGKEIYTWEHDTLFLNNFLNLVPEMKISETRLHNMSPSYYESHSQLIPLSQSRTFYLRLIGIFEVTKMPFFNTKQDLVFEFTPASTILTAGSGQCDLTSMDFVFDTLKMDQADKAHTMKSYSSALHTRNFLSVQPVKKYAVALANSTEVSVDLDSINGQVAFFALIIRSTSAANTANAFQNYHNIGDLGTIDIQDSGNQSIWSGPIEGQHLLSEAGKQVASDLCEWRSVYLIPFCRSISEAFSGVKNGLFTLRNDKYQLKIKPSAAGVATVETLNCTNAGNDAGAYSLRVGKSETATQAFNETAANLKIAVDALIPMRQAKYGPVTTTFSGTLETDSTVTYATHWGKPVVDEPIVQMNEKNLSDGAVAETCSASISTVGSNGFTDATVDISLYAYCHSTLQNRDGTWSRTDS